MPQVRIQDNEPFDSGLRRFKRLCDRAGVLTEIRRREYYEKPTWRRKREKAAAIKRYAKKMERMDRRTHRKF